MKHLVSRHCTLTLDKAIEPRVLESAQEAINRDRFANGLQFRRAPATAAEWGSLAAWIVEVPTTDHWFCQWLMDEGKSIHVRYVLTNPWLHWVVQVFVHELAHALRVSRFDDGVQMVNTCAERFGCSYSKYLLSRTTRQDVQDWYRRHVPVGWGDEE